MGQTTRVLAINGSYRDDGITDQAVGAAAQALNLSGAQVETILLREHEIEFCLNCRACTQEPGVNPGQCVHDDRMRELIEKIEQADGYILAAPTNMGSVTAIFKRFMERLTVYAYWPWGAPAPVYRKTKMPKKKALLVSSCAAPGLMGRWLLGTNKQLKMTARTIGAEPVGTLFTGLIAGAADTRLPVRASHKAETLAKKLL
ncbi:MAG: flavodoxin family protein [Gammaproteobacteria bacterium]|nr:flavodoxin family protein [Gammaproteobacteria bacterium]